MEKMPIEIFIKDQLKRERYRSIIAQLGVDALIVEIALVTYLREQGVYLVSNSLATELAERMARDLEQKNGFKKMIAEKAQSTKR